MILRLKFNTGFYTFEFSDDIPISDVIDGIYSEGNADALKTPEAFRDFIRSEFPNKLCRFVVNPHRIIVPYEPLKNAQPLRAIKIIDIDRIAEKKAFQLWEVSEPGYKSVYIDIAKN